MGVSLIQLLPINDTANNGEWADSYPYKQVSCFALHPIFIDLLCIPEITPEQVDIVSRKKWDLERLPALDYPEVYRFKIDMLREIFDANATKFSTDPNLREFVRTEGEWLKPYSLFCYLRDQNRSSDYESWPQHSRITAAQVNALCEEHEEQILYYYWVQYVADEQYRKSFDYATEHRVGIKGDLPIGVNKNSVECWYQPELFNMGMGAGAPPDAFSGDGQLWGFPTYNWEVMERDDFKWWRKRLERTSKLYHVLRVDHILGFFRIWQVPRTYGFRGLLGHYNPCIPYTRHELEQMGLWDIDRYVQPYMPFHIIREKFGTRTEEIIARFMRPKNVRVHDDFYEFTEDFDNEYKITEYLKTCEDYEHRVHDLTCLQQLVCNVLLVRDPKDENLFHPRTHLERERLEKDPVTGKMVEYPSSSWKELDEPMRSQFSRLLIEFQYERQTELWARESHKKLDLLKYSTNMLICGEDLGQLTDSILGILKEKGLLSLRVQRMSKNPQDDFDDYNQFTYLSVACPATHDGHSIRGWWEDSREETRKFWRYVLQNHTPYPEKLTPEISEQILSQNLWSNSMWCIFLFQDFIGLDHELSSRQNPKDEIINDPSNPDNKWRYRYPFTLEEIINTPRFTNKVLDLARRSGRC
jgi:4-alpha-glucanotransferase